MFVPLHNKSDHSLGLGTAPVEALLCRAADYGYAALALTDVETLAAQVRFHHAAQALNLKPITGVELRSGFGPAAPGRKAGRLVLLARDRAGYESLCRIITRRRARLGEPTGDPVACLEANPQGIFYLSDDPAVLESLLGEGVAATELRLLVNGTLRMPPIASRGVRAVAAVDAVMLEPSDHPLHLLLAAIRQRSKVYDVAEIERSDAVLPSPAEAARRFGALAEAVAESQRVAEACTLDLCSAPVVFPTLALPAGTTPGEELTRRCRESLESYAADPRYRQRLEQELGILGELGFAGYFLVVAEIAAFARRRGIALAGRGSAASSLVAFLLGLTTVDPVRHGLCFERFVHPGRRDLPDIDLDLPSDRRDEVIAWVFRRFGPDRVAMVATHTTFGRRAAYREGLKALGMAQSEINRYCERIPEDQETALARQPPLPIRFREAEPVLERLIGRPQHLSVHPGGIVLAQPRVDCYAPLETAPKGVPVTQYDMISLEQIGLLKLDLLGNRALAALEETRRWLGSRAVAPTDSGDDDAVRALLRAGNTIGCFQIETPAMRSLLRKLPVREVDDLIAVLALVRPGPASGEAKAAYIRRARGEEPPTPPHPRLADQLRSSYGMLLYEEDLMVAIAGLTGWRLQEADEFRAELLRADPGSAALGELEQRFVRAAGATGVPAAESLKTWQVLQRFVAYSFNKAHAASYAQLAWQAALLKARHPLEFACGVLNNYGGQYPLRSVAADFVRNGVPVLAPHVNASQASAAPEAGSLRLGLASVKYLTAKNRERLRRLRPFADVADLLRRVPLQFRELEALVLAGACDGLPPLAAASYPMVHEEFLTRWRRLPELRTLEQLTDQTPGGAYAETYSALVRAGNELRFLGLHPSAHPMAILRDEARRQGCLTIAELGAHPGKPVRLAGLVAATRRFMTPGGPMQFVTLEDESGLVEAILRPGLYASLRDPISNPGPLLVEGRVESDRADFHVLVSGVSPFHSRPAPYREPSRL